MIEVRGLHVRLGQTQVLRGLDASFNMGWTAVIGPNGAGKTTLLRAMAGLIGADQGGVWLQGRALADWPAPGRARRIAWMAQASETVSDLSVRDVVMLGRLPHLGMVSAPGAHDEAAVAQAMRDTECHNWADRRLSELSGGERQRVLLARALAVQAQVLLLDEPTAHLDPPHQMGVVRLLRSLAQQRAVVTVLHDLNLALRADRLLVLAAGALAAHGASHDPSLHRSLESVFGHAVRVQPADRGWVAVPKLD